MLFTGENDKVFNGCQLVIKLLQHWNKSHIGKQDTVFGMINNVLDLLFEQTRVYRVADHTQATDSVVQLEVAVVIPRQGRNTIARLHAHIY